MKTIPLTQGKVALVDDCDYEKLSQHKWHARKDLNTYYAQRRICKDGKWILIHMHREIIGTPDGMKTDHIDRDGLNNQRANLRVCTHQENMMNMRKRKDNTSGDRNVYWKKSQSRWEVLMQYKNKTYYGGEYKDKNDAIQAAKELRERITSV